MKSIYTLVLLLFVKLTWAQTLQTVTDNGAVSTNALVIGSPLSIKASAPYVQFLSLSSNRQGYIQHNGNNLVIASDLGNIIFNPIAFKNVGINTDFPLQTLDVNGKLAVRGTGTNFNNPNSAELQIGYGFASAGTPGIVSRLALQPYGHTGGPWTFNARDDASSAYLDIDYGTNKNLTIHHDGNVGIGTISPDERLDVNGMMAVRGTGLFTIIPRVLNYKWVMVLHLPERRVWFLV